MSTVFDNIVTKENHHTNLLCNILERNTRAAAVVLSYLLERPVPDEVAATLEFKAQHSFLSLDGREIPDILVEGQGLCCLIEAKIDPTLGLTEGQKRGYRGCFPSVGGCHLSFLVPHGWKHQDSVDQVEAALPQHISVHTSSWWGLVRRLEEVNLSLADDVIKEAVEFWKWRFKFERMTPEERDSLSLWSGEKYSAIRKLEMAVTQAKQLFMLVNSRLRLKHQTPMVTASTSSVVTHIFFGSEFGTQPLLRSHLDSPLKRAIGYGLRSLRSRLARQAAISCGLLNPNLGMIPKRFSRLSTNSSSLMMDKNRDDKKRDRRRYRVPCHCDRIL